MLLSKVIQLKDFVTLREVEPTESQILAFSYLKIFLIKYAKRKYIFKQRLRTIWKKKQSYPRVARWVCGRGYK